MRSSGYLGPRRNRLAAETGSDGHRYADVLVRWRLKNGREVRRSYKADLAALKADAEKLYSDPGFLHAAYPALKPEASEFAAVNYREWDDPRHVEFSSEAEKDRLISTWQAEFETLTAQQREKESPIGALQFKTRGMQEMIDALRAGKGNYTSFNDYYYYPVYPSFTKTIALLEDLGIEAGKGIAAEHITSIGVHYYGPFSFREDEKLYDSGYPRATREDEGTFVVSDPEQIREVMEHAVPTGLGISNPEPHGRGGRGAGRKQRRLPAVREHRLRAGRRAGVPARTLRAEPGRDRGGYVRTLLKRKEKQAGKEQAGAIRLVSLRRF